MDEHVSNLRRWIRGLAEGRGFVTYRQSFDFARELADLAAQLELEIEEGDPEPALELAEGLLRSGEAILERVDDSAGTVSGELRDAAVLWLRAARRVRDAGRREDWLARIENLMADDGYGLFDKLLPNASILLSEPELRELAARFEAKASISTLDSKHGDHDAFVAGVRLGQLAWPVRDPSVFVRSIRMRSPEPNALQMESIAECFLELDDPEGALEWLGGDWGRHEGRRLELRTQALAALGKEDEVVATLREVWNRYPSAATLEPLLDRLPPDDRAELKEEALERAPSLPDVETGLSLLVWLGRPEEAENLLLRRMDDIRGHWYTFLKPMAQDLEDAGHPLASSLIYRALLDSILDRGNSRAYHHAVRYFSHLADLARKVEDWRGAEDQAQYVVGLRERHGRKWSFWKRVDGARS